MPLPQLLYAQVIKVTRRRRLVRVSHRVVFGALGAIEQVLATHGWHINLLPLLNASTSPSASMALQEQTPDNLR